ncbi:hypothetical protein AT2G07806 [Arabidopsis thaliana]|uniref:Uncharacterized protein n=1 Tax=Arabidopsis thaliana TaxID=3702 RepID=F4INF0_ARATH|nr:uncharacterized protein AT2G07806 [Arabidopsis thaliana]AEC06119.1 hypothetical protein AT2G07806 [Arabidopsis thaliana]|eukprot:NP_001154508.1 hypothetical protein AT2G07806 [Arabidopsis thaliana]
MISSFLIGLEKMARSLPLIKIGKVVLVLKVRKGRGSEFALGPARTHPRVKDSKMWLMEVGRAYEFICNNMKEEPCVPDHDIGTASSQKGDCARKMAVKIMDKELVKQHPDDIHVPTTGTASAFIDVGAAERAALEASIVPSSTDGLAARTKRYEIRGLNEPSASETGALTCISYGSLSGERSLASFNFPSGKGKDLENSFRIGQKTACLEKD